MNIVPKALQARLGKLDTRQIEAQSMVIPGIIFLIIFSYIPMYGLIIAFKQYNIISGFWGAPWVGFKHFKDFLSYEKFYRVLTNTLGINLMQLILGFPAPIIFALLLNEIRNLPFKKAMQSVSYLPYFLSWVIFAGIIISLLSMDGMVNRVLSGIGLSQKPIFFLGEPKYFWFIVVFSGILKNFGWGSIIYLAAITGVDIMLYDSAVIDGANRFQKIWYVTLPSILGTVVILLIFDISNIVNSGFDQIWMFFNTLNASRGETIDIYVYRIGIEKLQYSYATAVGLMKSVVSVILLSGANFISKKVTNHGLY